MRNALRFNAVADFEAIAGGVFEEDGVVAGPSDICQFQMAAIVDALMRKRLRRHVRKLADGLAPLFFGGVPGDVAAMQERVGAECRQWCRAGHHAR